MLFEIYKHIDSIQTNKMYYYRNCVIAKMVLESVCVWRIRKKPK